jgi:hypothetical protein
MSTDCLFHPLGEVANSPLARFVSTCNFLLCLTAGATVRTLATPVLYPVHT